MQVILLERGDTAVTKMERAFALKKLMHLF